MILAHCSTEMVCVYILCHQEIRDQGDTCSDFIERDEESNRTIEIYLSNIDINFLTSVDDMEVKEAFNKTWSSVSNFREGMILRWGNWPQKGLVEYCVCPQMNAKVNSKS